MTEKSLPEVLRQIPTGMVVSPVPEVSISGIAIDSRRVQPGDLFVALRGGSADGHRYIDDAVSRGAAAIACEIPSTSSPAPTVQLKDTREALSFMAAAFRDWPARKLTVIGVTGTDGKTTTTSLIHGILREAGVRAGMISTVSAVIGGEELDTGFHVTTPDAHDVQYYLSQMVEAGLTHVVLETTSHGWAQHRVDACEFDIGVVTNITHEHLDEHGSYEAYRAAKARLFLSLAATAQKKQGNPRLGILNRDDQSFEYLDGLVAVNKLNYGINEGADVQATNIRLKAEGAEFQIEGKGLRVAISSGMEGLHNISNCLAALSTTVFGLGIPPATAVKAIAKVPRVPGRMERIEMGQDFTAIVDFAHTPNALRVTLETAHMLRQTASTGGRVIAVFGSAGLRDRAKRRMMAEVSTQLADLTILTAEDPRTESLDAILEEMASSARSLGGRENETFWRVPDRGEAIRLAVRLAKPGDIVLACGKGHEQSMCFGKVEHAWDDRTAMRAALAERLGVRGPDMPYLPTRDTTEAAWLR